MIIMSFFAGRSRRKMLASVMAALFLTIMFPLLYGQTKLGDAGHFLTFQPRIHLFNPSGEAFTVTVRPMKWGHGEWNKPHVKAKVTDPSGEVITKGKQTLKDGTWTFKVPDGPEGVYRLEPTGGIYIESSLDHSVVWTGDPDAHAIDGRRVTFNSTVPRRWWFWVPKDANQFTVKAQRASRYMSQREDWALFIYSPRGQRMRSLVGQPPYRKGPYEQDQKVTVPVEPGTAGRFWSVRVAYGDSHNYSVVNFALKGIPQYISRSPEEWFNPETGKRPDVSVYDKTSFFWTAPKKKMMKKRWPKLEHFSPVPSLGDPDGIQMRKKGRFALWNPDGRTLKFRIGSYLPRKKNKKLPKAHVHITGPDGKTVLEEKRPLEHAHSKKYYPEVTLKTGKGVSRGTVTDAFRWFLYTYPATPLVMTPRKGISAKDRWSSFRFTAAAARNWYFYVPDGTETFSLRYDAKYDTDVIHMQVCAPNMAVDRLYGNNGETTIEVPEGLDGKIWYIRPKIGEASRITQDGPPFRYQQSPMTVEIKGVPPYFAPTWEQWFHPEHPEKPLERGTKKEGAK